MLNRIKNNIEKELIKFARRIDRDYALSKISPLLFKSTKDFILRKGKRIRPALFIAAYLGFAKKQTHGLYASALAIELLHDFMLVHDDIIDKSPKRRGRPSLHKMLDAQLAGYKNIKFNGQDLSIIIGDVMYAIAIKAFLTIKENALRKERALKKFIEAAVYTGSGQFIEILNGAKPIEKISKKDIYDIYNYKTARYTFSTPLATGALLAGANQGEIDKLFKFGLNLGIAFQIKDDILGMFGDEKKTGKSELSDLREAKKTILIWQAYNNSGNSGRLFIKRLFAKKKVSKADLSKMRRIIKQSGALEYAGREINRLVNKAGVILESSHMHKNYKAHLSRYPREILDL